MMLLTRIKYSRESFSGPARATGDSWPAEAVRGHCVSGVVCVWDVCSAAGATVIDEWAV